MTIGWKRCWRIFCAMGLLASAIGVQAQESATPSVGEWRRDLVQMTDDLQVLHPDAFTKIGEKAFRRELERLLDIVPTLSDEERLVQAMRLVALLGDGHTLVEPADARFALWYPVRVQEFTDGYHIVSAHESVAEMAGAQVVALAGQPPVEVAAVARSLIGVDNPSGAKDRLDALHNAAIMRGLGLANERLELAVTLRLADGATVDRLLPPMRTTDSRFPEDDATFTWRFRPEVYGVPIGSDDEWVTAFEGLRSSEFATPDLSRPVHLTDRLPYSHRALPQSDAYYVRMNQVDDTGFVTFLSEVMTAVDNARPRHLIFDWRQNFGGDGSRLRDMTRQLLKRADDPPWTELYILTGPKTFSAAVMAVDAVLDNVPATIVGEPSAAGLNHFGDPAWRTYPVTGLRLSVSTRWWQLSHSADLSEFVRVDVPAAFSFADFIEGRDPAVDPILEGEDMRSIPAIARDEGGEKAARVFSARRETFSGIWWWSPPEEIELRRTCDELLEQERIDDAVATCELNAAIHPDVWNVWYNLATAQRAAGQSVERLASYRCVVMIEPNNWNVPSILELLARPGNDGAQLPAGCPADEYVARPPQR